LGRFAAHQVEISVFGQGSREERLCFGALTGQASQRSLQRLSITVGQLSRRKRLHRRLQGGDMPTVAVKEARALILGCCASTRLHISPSGKLMMQEVTGLRAARQAANDAWPGDGLYYFT